MDQATPPPAIREANSLKSDPDRIQGFRAPTRNARGSWMLEGAFQ